MGLMDLFGKRKSAAGATQGDEPTAIDYVDWLLQYMLSTSKMTLTLDTSRALPGSGTLPEGIVPPPCLPDASVVINRLKILAGVNPVRQSKTIEGTFDRPRKSLTIITTCRFQDEEEKSTCSIRLQVKRLDV